MKRKLGLVSVVMMLLGLAVAVAPAAQAAARNGRCEAGEFCLYYNSNSGGSMADFPSSMSTYGTGSGCYKFLSSGTGRGKCVKNNAASVWNRESGPVTVFYKSGYAGALQSFGAGKRGNFNSTLKNENAGHRVGSASRTNLSTGLYYNGGGHISTGFDGYLTTSGRHEGIDIAKGLGYSVRALVSGKVVRVAQGYRGRSGLSTIAIYNASVNRTVVYLHSDPLNSLRAGQSIAKGQKIGVEDWRGVSYASSAHTHVEMRTGRQGYAAVSVGDPNLTNPNPTGFWEARGYNICCG